MSKRPGPSPKSISRASAALAGLGAVAVVDFLVRRFFSERAALPCETTRPERFFDEEELQAVINSMEDGVVIIDTEGRIAMLNPFGREMIELGDLPGRIAERASPEELDLAYPNGTPIRPEDLPSRLARGGERVSSFEMVIGLKRGRPRTLSVSAAPIRSRNGEISGAAVIYHDVTERRRAEQELQRRNRELQIVSDISATVARTLDLTQIIEQATDRIVELLQVDVLTFYLLDEETMTLRLFTHRGIGETFLKSLSEIRVGEDLTGITAETGLPIAVEDLQADPRTDRSIMEAEGLRSYAGVPIKARGRTIGVMPIATRTTRRFIDRDLALLSIIGNQIGTAVENARIYERERDIAETLQESLLGKAPVIPRFEIGVVYESAGEVAQVGGDFFDFIEFANGAVAVVIGDVSGKGLGAATLTAMAKNTVRAFAYENHSPDVVLTRSNEVITAETAANEFVTLLFVLLDLPSNLIRISSAGHPPAFICDGDCSLSLAAQGLPLGAFKQAKYEQTSVEMTPGQLLILYTDGLTDARMEGRFFGTSGIAEVATRFKTQLGVEELAGRLVRSAKDFAGGRLPDDVAVIVLKVGEEESAEERFAA